MHLHCPYSPRVCKGRAFDIKHPSRSKKPPHSPKRENSRSRRGCPMHYQLKRRNSHSEYNKDGQYALSFVRVELTQSSNDNIQHIIDAHPVLIIFLGSGFALPTVTHWGSKPVDKIRLPSSSSASRNRSTGAQSLTGNRKKMDEEKICNGFDERVRVPGSP